MAGHVLRGTGRLVLGLLLLLLIVLGLFRIAAAVRETETRPPPGIVLIPTPLGRVAAAVSGPPRGPPILLVHGTAAWSGFWREVADHLAARGWRVIAIDLPPFGWSDRDPDGRYGRPAQAQRLSAVLRAAAGKRAAVVLGHSFGAGPAIELALRHPLEVRSLVLVDAALGALDPESGDPLAARFFRLPLVGQATASTLIANPTATGPMLRSLIARNERAEPWLDTIRAPMRRRGTTAAYARWLPSLFETADGALSRRAAALSEIKVPVALIWGEADTVTPIAQGRRIAALTRARSFAVLPGTGHIPHIEDPEHFLAALDSALAPGRGR
jgi:pimeloyl-ACP methyl ester carboxylesterase